MLQEPVNADGPQRVGHCPGGPVFGRRGEPQACQDQGEDLAADALSRRSKLPAALYKLSVIVSNDEDYEDFIADMKARIDAIEAGVHSVMRSDKIKVITWDRLYEAANEKPLMVKLMEVVLRWFPTE